MGLLKDDDIAAVRQRLGEMKEPVRLIHFTQEMNLEYGREAKELLQDLVDASGLLSLEVHNFLLEKDKVEEYRVDKVPATVIRNGKDFGIRFYGLPAGYEFGTLLDTILNVSNGDSGLAPETAERLCKITQPVHLEVFVTPT